jgi:hypothetical protein
MTAVLWQDCIGSETNSTYIELVLMNAPRSVKVHLYIGETQD